ncbi:MAG: DsbA family oxidoreductase [bacterium]
MTQTPVVVDYFSDVLCVWAWIAQRRVNELHRQFGDLIKVRYRYIDVFGDTAGKIESQWRERDSYQGFASHVLHSAATYEDAPVHANIWQPGYRPTTSATAHTYLKATELVHDADTARLFATALRRAFFVDGLDIARGDVIEELLAVENCDLPAIRNHLKDGTAIAALMHDYQEAKNNNLRGSPSYVMGNGRQILWGNVGYRVLSANVEELIKKPTNEASWC